MRAILFIALLASTAAAGPSATPAALAVSAAPADSSAFDAVRETRARVALTRERWDVAVAAGHPVAAGRWARRHFDALQLHRAALEHWKAANEPTAAPARG